MQLLQETRTYQSRLLRTQSKNRQSSASDQKSSRHEEVNYVGSSAEILSSDPNILSIENPIELEVLLTIEESSIWLLDSGASYHVTPHQSQFRQYRLDTPTQFELEIRDTAPSSESAT